MIAASIYDKHSIGPCTRPIYTSYSLTMTNMIQVCSQFHWVGVCIIDTRPDETNACLIDILPLTHRPQTSNPQLQPPNTNLEPRNQGSARRSSTTNPHPGVELRANVGSTFGECYLIQVAFSLVSTIVRCHLP